MMKYLISFLFSCNALVCSQVFAQPSIDVLGKFAVYQLKPTYDTTDDFSDLTFLTDLLKDKKIILLGEQSHGDGATIEAKVRLIRFLHSRLGFDMLSFESGFYDNYKAGLSIKGADPQKSPLLESIFPIWSETKEFLPLMAYIHSKANTTRPLLVSGFDCQESSYFERTYFTDLKEALDGSVALSEEEASNLEIVISSGPELLIGSPKDSLTFFNATARINRALERKIEQQSTPHLAILKQTLISWLALVRLQIDDINEKPVPVQNPRDWQMAQNLLFLSHTYPDKKIICWGASYHFSKNTSSIANTPLTMQMVRTLDSMLKNEEPSTIDLKDAVPMGQILAGHFGKSLYSLAFSSYDGSFGMLGTPPISLAPLQPPAESIESELVKKTFSTAFVDYSSGNRKIFFYSSSFGNIPIHAQWATMFDGQFFIKTSFPPSYPVTKSQSINSSLPVPDKKSPVNFKPNADEKRVINAHTLQGVDYASVYLMNTSQGILTNANGAFVFNIPDRDTMARIIISSIGFESDTLSIKDFFRRNTFGLNPKAYEMESVTIRAKSLSAREIVKRAEKRIKSNYYQEHSRQEFFFRTRTLVEDTVTFNEEAAVLVDNPSGFHAGSQVEKDLTGSILQFRNTTQNASKDRWGGTGSIWLMYSHNMIIKKSNALHRIAFYNYTLSGTTVLEHRSVYKITFECKRPMSFTTGYGYPAPQSATGVMFIDKENFSVLKIEMMVRRKPHVQKTNPDVTIDPWMHYQVETYKEFNGKYFLNSSRQIHYSKVNDRKKNTALRRMQMMELIATKINTEPAQPLELSLFKIKSSMPKADSNFWNVHNFSVEEHYEQLYKLFESE